MQTPLLFERESYLIRAACFEVYRAKGCGLFEPVYKECMQIELRLQGVPYVCEAPLLLEYKSNPLQCSFRSDFICFERIILEIKAVTELNDEHRAQIQNYLRATGLSLGILANFGHFPKMQIERFVMGEGRYRAQTTRKERF